MDPITDDPQIPESLRHAMRSSQPAPSVPRDMDESILNDAHAHFARHNRFRRLIRWLRLLLYLILAELTGLAQADPTADVASRSSSPRYHGLKSAFFTDDWFSL